MPPPAPGKPLSLPLLTAMVVGTMLASGIFTLPRSFAQTTGPLGLTLVWLIAGTGTLMLALVFQRLAQRRPDLDAGVFAYAKAGFGPYLGFLSALGYWSGACLLSVAYFVLMKATFGRIVPGFGDGNTPQAVLVSSVILWTTHVLVLRGAKKAALVNGLVTVAKVLSIGGAVAILVLGFRVEVFVASFWGGGTHGWADIPGQVRAAMVLAVYVFLGIEGASVYSRYASNRDDVGKATLWGLTAVAVLFFLMTLLPYGVLPQDQLATLRNPSMAGILEAVVGRWGSWLVSVALVVALAGAFLSRSLLSAEVLFQAAKADTVPRIFARQNARGVPVAALWLSSAMVQVLLLLTLIAEEAYGAAFKLTSAMILVPYLLVAAFAWKLARVDGRRGDRRIAGAALAYAIFLLWAAGPKLLLASSLLYAPGTLLYLRARREQGLPPFGRGEAVAFAVVLALAAVAFPLLATGNLRL